MDTQIDEKVLRNRAAVKKHYYANKEYYYAKNQKRADKSIRFIKEYKATHPCRCGESDPVCLDFHHRDPKEKDLEISKATRNWGITRLQKEIDKCDLLCANCHRKEHYRLKMLL